MIYRILLSLLILAGLVLMPFSATALDIKDKEFTALPAFQRRQGGGDGRPFATRKRWRT